jgi:structure-specific recognition protein 1
MSLRKASGRLKVAEAGIGWKNALTGQIVTISATDIKKVSWARVAKDYELKILKSDGNYVRFDGFPKDVSLS